ncbi:hypothetical protein D3C80_2194750 [compost metagenome]
MVEGDIGLDAEEVHAGFLADGGAASWMVSHGGSPISGQGAATFIFLTDQGGSRTRGEKPRI